MKTTQFKIYSGQTVFRYEVPLKQIRTVSGRIVVEFNNVEHCDK